MSKKHHFLLGFLGYTLIQHFVHLKSLKFSEKHTEILSSLYTVPRKQVHTSSCQMYVPLMLLGRVDALSKSEVSTRGSVISIDRSEIPNRETSTTSRLQTFIGSYSRIVHSRKILQSMLWDPAILILTI